MGKLILLARYWNDMDFLKASLNQVSYWEADKVYLSEGAWDQNFLQRSTDGTREILEEYAKNKDNVFIIDNVRDDINYRVNQAETSNLVMKLAKWQPNDWMIQVDVDQFYTKAAIDTVKRMIKEEGDQFDYFTHELSNFLYDLKHHQITLETSQSRLPSRLLEGSYWIPTNHLTLNGKLYRLVEQIRKRHLTDIRSLHYEGLRPKSKLTLRYSVGDRKTFWEYRGGIRLKGIVPFTGNAISEFAADNLKGCCVFPEGALKYVKLHCNMDVMQYHNPPENEFVKKYFENESPNNVLELGCGLGRSSVGFYKAFSSWKKTNYFLLDGDSGNKQIDNINYGSNKDFYNKLDLTKKFCLANEIPIEQINILNAENPEVFSSITNIKFDFVYSFLAIGYHWFINLYLEKLLPFLHSGSILCFGIRPAKSEKFKDFNKYQIDRVSKDLFDILEVTTKGDFDSRLILRKK